jgi:hypothetical protein
MAFCFNRAGKSDTAPREGQARRDIGVLRKAERKDSLPRMSLFDKGSNASESLRKLVLSGGGQDAIGLTEEGSPLHHRSQSEFVCRVYWMV